jgi:hypothetical protein
VLTLDHFATFLLSTSAFCSKPVAQLRIRESGCASSESSLTKAFTAAKKMLLLSTVYFFQRCFPLLYVKVSDVNPGMRPATLIGICRCCTAYFNVSEVGLRFGLFICFNRFTLRLTLPFCELPIMCRQSALNSSVTASPHRYLFSPAFINI